MPKNFICDSCGEPHQFPGWTDVRTCTTLTASNGEEVPITDAFDHMCKPCHTALAKLTDTQLADYILAGGGWGNKPDTTRWSYADHRQLAECHNTRAPISEVRPRSGVGETKEYTDGASNYYQAQVDGNTWKVLRNNVVVKTGLSSAQKARQWIRKQLSSKVQNTGHSEPNKSTLLDLFRSAAQGSDEATDQLIARIKVSPSIEEVMKQALMTGEMPSDEDLDSVALKAVVSGWDGKRTLTAEDRQRIDGKFAQFTPDQLKVPVPEGKERVWLIYTAGIEADLITVEKDISDSGGYKQESFYNPDTQIAGYEVDTYDVWKFKKKLAKTYSACLQVLMALGKEGRVTYDLYREKTLR